jgi:imidazolonepropionase-like amidohydrolase
MFLMKPFILILLCIPCSLLLHAQTYITHTNVVDVINLKINSDETVVIAKGKIINVNKSSAIKIPAHAIVIDGSNKYLIPGLVDAHVHFFQSGGLYTRPDAIDLRKYHSYDTEITWTHQHFEDLLRRYLAAGITTVIDPGSTANFLMQRDSFKTKTWAPDIYMTGPLLTTYEPDAFKHLGNDEPFYLMQTDEEAKSYTQKELQYKPDFIKIWYIVLGNADSSAKASSHLVKAVIDEAPKHNLKVAVHATERITAQLAVEDGADYLVHSVDDEVISNDFIQLLKTHQVVLCPTLQVADNYMKTFAQRYQSSEADKALANPEALNSLFDLPDIPDTGFVNHYKKKGEAAMERYEKADSVMAVNLKKLVDAGIPVATGTDAGNIGTQHASSYFTELQLMQNAGMSIPQILQASTINGAKTLGKENLFGSIDKGKLANMVLLNVNPLENLYNWKQINLIINKGVAIKPGTIIQ